MLELEAWNLRRDLAWFTGFSFSSLCFLGRYSNCKNYSLPQNILQDLWTLRVKSKSIAFSCANSIEIF